MIGAAPPTSIQLGRIEDRVTFLYLERCTLSRDSNAITATDQQGTVHIPAAGINCVLLGPGTRITHHAMMLMAVCGVLALSAHLWLGRTVRHPARAG